MNPENGVQVQSGAGVSHWCHAGQRFWTVTTPPPLQLFAAPGKFIRTLKDAIYKQGMSLRQLTDKVGVSPAYLSRLLNAERGLPVNETIAKFEEVLDIQPRGALFDAAGRHDGVAAEFIPIIPASNFA